MIPDLSDLMIEINKLSALGDKDKVISIIEKIYEIYDDEIEKYIPLENRYND